MTIIETSLFDRRSWMRSRMSAPSFAPIAASGSPRRGHLAPPGAGAPPPPRGPLPLAAGELGDLDADVGDVRDAHRGEVLPGEPAHLPVLQEAQPDRLAVGGNVVGRGGRV